MIELFTSDDNCRDSLETPAEKILWSMPFVIALFINTKQEWISSFFPTEANNINILNIFKHPFRKGYYILEVMPEQAINTADEKLVTIYTNSEILYVPLYKRPIGILVQFTDDLSIQNVHAQPKTVGIKEVLAEITNHPDDIKDDKIVVDTPLYTKLCNRMKPEVMLNEKTGEMDVQRPPLIKVEGVTHIIYESLKLPAFANAIAKRKQLNKTSPIIQADQKSIITKLKISIDSLSNAISANYALTPKDSKTKDSLNTNTTALIAVHGTFAMEKRALEQPAPPPILVPSDSDSEEWDIENDDQTVRPVK